MAGDVEKFLHALEDYYGVKYSKVQFSAILSNLGRPPKAYLMEMYKVVINSISSQYGKVPDLAAMRKVQAAMDPPETFIEPQSLLPHPDAVAIITKAAEEAYEVKIKSGVANEEEVRRVGVKLAEGGGTKWEQHWYHCMTENDGVWKHPKDGPYAQAFLL
jgi:hypothetical protein